MIFSGRAEIIEEYADRLVQSASKVFNMPSIIRFLSKASAIFRRRRGGVKFNRKNVYLRDNGECQYCRCTVSMYDYTYDHVLPRAQGGLTSWENIVVACTKCNNRKANRTPEQARMPLIRKPVVPKSVPGAHFAQTQWGDSMPLSWKDYLASANYWTEPLGN